MDHNEFDFMIDLIRPFKDFLKRLNTSYGRDSDQLAALETQVITLESGLLIVNSDVDESQVEYCTKTDSFDILFDANLYEPPQTVVQYEASESKGKKEQS
jgi:hypothetical protein